MADVSATTAASGNSLTLSIPTNLLGGSGGANMLNLNYNYGGTTQDVANDAYKFLAGTQATQQNFVNQSIGSSQSFLSSLVQPVTASVVANTQTIGGLIPNIISMITGAFNKSVDVQNSLATQGLNASQAVAQSSIAVSKTAAKQGGCFITTAACESLSLPDDNVILRTLRSFRDSYMLDHTEGKRLVLEYYNTAPQIVEAIDRRVDRARIYLRMLKHFLIPACKAIEAGDNVEALAIYSRLVDYAKVKAHGH